MGIALLATFRETMEAALILGTAHASLEKTSPMKATQWLWLGAFAGSLTALAATVLLSFVTTHTSGQWQEAIDASISLGAAALLLWTAWRLFRSSAAISYAGKGALFCLSWITVARDAIEITLMLLSLAKQQKPLALGMEASVGGLSALLLVLLLYRSIAFFSPQKTRRITGIILWILIVYFLVDGATTLLG